MHVVINGAGCVVSSREVVPEGGARQFEAGMNGSLQR
jgi:hypothetical protein